MKFEQPCVHHDRPIKALGMCSSCYMKYWHRSTQWYEKNKANILQKSKIQGYGRLREQRKERVQTGSCTYSLCPEKIEKGTKMCKKHANESAIRNRRSHYHYTKADEQRFQKATICDWCGLPLGETPTQDHDHSCCSKKGFSCGKCLRGLVHRSCNLHAIAWFEWFEERSGITLPMLETYRSNFPRRLI